MSNKPYKFRDKRSGDVIEFNWEGSGKPSKADIDRVVAERNASAERKRPRAESPITQVPQIETPRFPRPPVLTGRGINAAVSLAEEETDRQLPSSNQLPPMSEEPSPIQLPNRFTSTSLGDRFLPEPQEIETAPTISSELGKVGNWLGEKGAALGRTSVGRGLGKGYNLATTPLFPEAEEAVFNFTDKLDNKGLISKGIRFVGEGTTSPLGLLTSSIGLPALSSTAKAALALRAGSKLGIGGKVGEEVVEDVVKATTKGNSAAARVGAATAKETAAKEFTEEVIDDIAPRKPKPKYRAVLDDEGKPVGGYLTGGEGPPIQISPEAFKIKGVDVSKLPEFQAQAAAQSGKKVTVGLPADLAGAKPKFNIGRESEYLPEFESDLDKAMFIIAQKNPSKNDARYLDFVMKNTGLDETGARSAGQAIRSQIRKVVEGQPSGSVTIPKIYKASNEIQSASEVIGKNIDVVTPESMGGVKKTIDVSQPIPGVPKEVTIPTNKPIGKVKPGNTTSVITGSEEGIPHPAYEQAAKQDIPSTGIAPSAQASQKAGEFVPTDGVKAMEQLDAVDEAMKAQDKPESFRRHVLTQMINFPKTTWASIDLSAPLRQGKALIYRPEYWTSLDDMFKSAWSEEGYKEVMSNIRSKKLFDVIDKYNPGITDLTKGGKLTAREENMMSSWAENIPSLGSVYRAAKNRDLKYARTYVFDAAHNPSKEALGKVNLLSRPVRAANRAYSGFLNTLRADTMENMLVGFEKAGLNPYKNPELVKATSDFIASATGRGSLGNFEAAASNLNTLAFSPRFLKSRYDLLVAPFTTAKHAGLRQEALNSWLGMAAYWSTMTVIAESAGATVNRDTTSSDFGKIKIGKTRIDTLAGIQQPMVATVRFMRGLSTSPTTGETTVLGEGYRAKTPIDVGVDFVRTKLSPWVGAAWDIKEGTTIKGQNTIEQMKSTEGYGTDNYFFKMFAPNLTSTMIDLYKEDPKWMMVLGIPAAFGESVQVFDDKPQSPSGRVSLRRPRRVSPSGPKSY
jgi:hypothetical protein